MMSEQPAIFGQQIRLAYLEARLFLDGEFSTTTLRQFDLSRQSASKDIDRLFKINPCFHYNASLKRYILDKRCKPRLLDKHQIPAFARYVESVYSMAYSPQISHRRAKRDPVW